LDVWKLQCNAELLATLPKLSGLTGLSLCLGIGDASVASEGVGVVCQLTRLRQLYLKHGSEAEGLLLQLTQLQQLTCLSYDGFLNGEQHFRYYHAEVGHGAVSVGS
jgi:hypothetical protein